MRFLAVDDDPIILELLTQFVMMIGDHDIATAESGHEAIDLIQVNPSRFDCFLFDIQMPGMDGIELSSQVRAIKGCAATPILMLTAMADKRYVDAAFAAGATDYVTKPFEMAELTARVAAVEELLESRKIRTSKVFAAQSLETGSGTDQRIGSIELCEPISIYDVENVIEYLAMENYIAQLSRSALFGSTTFAFTIRKVDGFHDMLSSFEFASLISDVAEVISDTLTGHQFLMSYAGSGTYVCITESGWRPDTNELMKAVNLSLATTELYDNNGQRLQPRVSAGQPVRLIWKTGASVMEALATAHASAEAACSEHERSKVDFWQVGRTA